ncbi:hypothetical protein MRX96_012717 [Rhipicephalus microplus]
MEGALEITGWRRVFVPRWITAVSPLRTVFVERGQALTERRKQGEEEKKRRDGTWSGTHVSISASSSAGKGVAAKRKAIARENARNNRVTRRREEERREGW